LKYIQEAKEVLLETEMWLTDILSKALVTQGTTRSQKRKIKK